MTFPNPALVLVTDSARLRGRRLEDIVDAAIEGGVNVVQLREKTMMHDELCDLGARLMAAIAGRALLFVNGDAAAAAAVGAAGVHLPENTADLRIPAGLLVSRAVHSVGAARAAVRDGADVVQFGTMFETVSKPGVRAVGIDGLRDVVEAVRVRVIAIGGITAANAADVMRAGAAGIAVIGAIFDAPDPRVAAAELRSAIGREIGAR